MPRSVLLFVSALALTGWGQTAPVATGGVTLSTGTRLIVVDVVVLDSGGRPVHGLKSTDFMLEENRKPQVVRNFDEHVATEPATRSGFTLPPLPPGTFTDYQSVPPDSTLNVLLLDALNTPMTDQSYVRNQLQQYVKHAAPGVRIAIFGLSQRLTLLQGFSSDPEVLKAAVEHKLLPRASVLLNDPSGAGVDTPALSDTLSQFSGSSSGQVGVPSDVVANLQQFEAQNASFQSQLRATYTIDAFNALGRYLAQFPGRKNLIWFSGSFPLSIFGDPDLSDPFAVQADSSQELRDAANVLNRARVAVYPVDARGLQTNPVFDASRSGTGYARNPARLAKDISAFNEANAEEHMTMDQVAEDTGGHAFYNTNDLASAVTKSITAGSNYYTLTYTPTERPADGSYRSIKVALQGPVVAQGVKLSYRHGYYAEGAGKRAAASSSSVAASPQPAAAPAPLPASTMSLRSSSMQRGAPTLSEVLFKVRVLPASTATEETAAPGNVLGPGTSTKGPFRRFLVDFAVVGGDFELDAGPDGRRHGAADFITYVYDADGNLLNAAGSSVQMNLEAATYAKLVKSGVGYHQEISVPAKGESFLRLGVHDVRSNRIGVVEVPVSAVSRLAPPPATAPPATAPAAAAPSTPAARGPR